MSLSEQTVTTLAEGIAITAMTEHDLLEVVEIEESSGLSRWGWAAYYAELQGNNRHLMLVARVAELQSSAGHPRVAGYIVGRMGADELHINNVAVREDYRRRGIGRALLRLILEEGKTLRSSLLPFWSCGPETRRRLHFMKSVAFASLPGGANTTPSRWKMRWS